MKSRAQKKRTRSWRDQIDIHPAAELFPLMSEGEPEKLRAMAESIAKSPLQVPDLMPVVHGELLNPDYSSLSQMKWKFTLLDGRNRLDAMTLAGIKFALRPNPASTPSAPGWLLDVDRGGLVVSHPLEVEKGDPWEYVRRANLERRMLNRAETRALIRQLLKAAPEKSDRAIGKLAKSDKNTIASERAKMEARGEIHHVKTRVDSKGRRSPARRKTKTSQRRSVSADTERNSPAGTPAATPEAPAAPAVTTQTAQPKPPLQWIDGSEGEPWTGDMEATDLLANTADGKQFEIRQYRILGSGKPHLLVRVTIKDKLKTLQQAIDIAEAYHADPNAPLPKTESEPEPAAKGNKKKETGAEAPAPRPELTPEESAAERKAHYTAAGGTALTVAPSATVDPDTGRMSVPERLEPPQKVKRGGKSADEDLTIPGFLLRKRASDEAGA